MNDFKFEIPEKMRLTNTDSYWIRDEEIGKLVQQVQEQLDAGAPEAYGVMEFKIQIRVAGYGPVAQRPAIPAHILVIDNGDKAALFVSPPPTIRCATDSTEAFIRE